MGIKVMARNNRFPQNINRQIQYKTIRVKMEQRNVKKSGQHSRNIHKEGKSPAYSNTQTQA